MASNRVKICLSAALVMDWLLVTGPSPRVVVACFMLLIVDNDLMNVVVTFSFWQWLHDQ